MASAPIPSSIAIIAAGAAPVRSFPFSPYAFETNTGKRLFSFAASSENTQHQKLRVTAPDFYMGQMLLSVNRGASFTFDTRAVFSPVTGELDVLCRTGLPTSPAGTLEIVGLCLCDASEEREEEEGE